MQEGMEKSKKKLVKETRTKRNKTSQKRKVSTSELQLNPDSSKEKNYTITTESVIPHIKSRNTSAILQGYTYFLNDYYSTFVSIGFDAESYAPILQISAQNHYFGVDSIKFSRVQWVTFYEAKENIEERLNISAEQIDDGQFFFHGSIINEKATDTVKIDFMTFNNTTCIVFTQNEVSVILTKLEFIKLTDLNDFFNFTLIYNNSVKFYIKEYCENYVTSCKNQSVKKMDSKAFKPPMDLRPPINYFRLFHEIPYVYDNICNINTSNKM